MTRSRRASIILTLPALLLLTGWIAAYSYPPFGGSETLAAYFVALAYLCFASAAFAAIRCALAHQSRHAIVCLVINLAVVALTLFGGGLLRKRAILYRLSHHPQTIEGRKE
jgi:hypothetical protein